MFGCPILCASFAQRVGYRTLIQPSSSRTTQLAQQLGDRISSGGGAGIGDWGGRGGAATWAAKARRSAAASALSSPNRRFSNSSRSEERRVGKEGRSRWSPDH